MTADKYLQLAKEYAASQDYPMVRFVEKNEDGAIYNITDPKEWGLKLGHPTFILITKNEDIIEILDFELIQKYHRKLSAIIKARKSEK